MNTPGHTPLAHEDIYTALGTDMLGAANVLVALAEAQKIVTIEELISAMRSHMNEYGNLQFITREENRAERLNLGSPPEFDEMTVILVGEHVDEAVRRLREGMAKQLAV